MLDRGGSNVLPTMSFADRLKLSMELSQVSGTQLARSLVNQQGELGVSRQAVYLALKGDTRAFSAENCARAAKAMRVDMYWLATGEGVPRKTTDATQMTALELLSALADRIMMTPPSVRPAIASNLSGWALEGGPSHYSTAIAALLDAQPRPASRAPKARAIEPVR